MKRIFLFLMRMFIVLVLLLIFLGLIVSYVNMFFDYVKDNFVTFLIICACSLIPIIIYILFNKEKREKYGYINNKKISKEDIPMFRDIPCNKDIHYANALIMLNNFDYDEINIMGAIILKWIKENKISFKNEKNGVFNKDTSIIDLTMNPEFDNPVEIRLFDMMCSASEDGLLEIKEFERWCKYNYSRFLNFFKGTINPTSNQINLLKESKDIRLRKFKKECRYKNVMSDKIYNDSVQLYGLKKYLLEFSRMDTKEVMEVKLWDEYLMFACLFGIADKVLKQLKNMYPEILEHTDINGNVMFDYDMFMFINHLSMRCVSVASNAESSVLSARTAAESYSSGGGGFSRGGGGGGSFGGGGGGSR